MTILVLLLRGVRSRALLSGATLVLMVVAVGGTVLGPAFQDAVTASYTLTRVAETPAPQTALTFGATPGRRGTLADLGERAAAAVTAELPASYGPPEVTYVVGPVYRGGDLAEFTFVGRDGACELLEIEGRCPETTDEVLINEDNIGGLRLGERTPTPGLGNPVVVGSYRTPDDSDDWLLPGRLASRPPTGATASRKGAIIVTQETLESLPRGLWNVQLDSRLVVPERFADDDLDTLVTDVEGLRTAERDLPGGGRLVGGSEANSLASVLVDVRAQRDAARATMTPAVASLALLALAVILRLVAAAAELRAPELALATLRGVGTRRTWLLGLAEPWFLVVLAAPLGVLAGYAATRALSASWLRSGTVVVLPAGSWVGALLVVAAIAGVAALVVGRSLRETLGARVAGVRRPAAAGDGRRTGVLVEAVVVVLAAALPLARLGTDADGLGVTELMLPVVTAVATGLLVTRATAAAAGWWTRRGVDGPLSVFVAARALARRAEGTLVILPVAAAIAVAVFATGVSGVADRWRGSVAATTTPADEVWTSPLEPQATFRLARDVDPDGRWAMSTAAVSSPDADPVVLVDAERLGRVGAWSDQWLDGRDAAAAAALVAPSAPLLRLTGDEVGVTGSTSGSSGSSGSSGPVSVVLSVANGGPGLDFVRLGPFTSEPSTATATTDACRDTCEVREIRVEGDSSVRLSDLTVDGTPSGAGLTDPGWRVAPDEEDAAPAPVEGGALVVEPDVDLVPAVAAEPVPVVVGLDASDGGGELTFPGTTVPVTTRARGESLPFVGPSGLMADLPTFLTRYQADPALVSSSVLLRSDAPDSVRRALTDAGLTRTATLAGTRSTLDDGAYAQALRLYGVVGAVLLLMALGGLLVSSAVQLPARRRDAAALRVVGVRRRTVVLASFWESVVALGAAALAGLGAGLLAQVVLLRSLTLGLVDDPTTPRVLPRLDGGGLLVLAGGVAAVLLVVATLGAGAVVRGARGATLREDAR
ncbi:FtsX-like permease family protein [Nocardioides sp.]|uniref:FtsX-like permease family protein n=1 Tax=Nocardioides sp. TaxID=35761 RepID=UPI00271BC736|nr:FtsX-like permease family protein [Nocardioides sp.]MDO9455619.1 hypothetical protein [Nocardioides sp.]